MTNNFPCKCGHPKDQHIEELTWGTWEMYCSVSFGSEVAHVCTFKPDNLKYLEDKFEENAK